MSGPVVFIGFFFLIPSVLGIIISALMLSGVLTSGVSDVTGARHEAIAQMRANDVPEPIIAAVVAGDDQTVDRLMSTWPNEPIEFNGRIITSSGLDEATRSWVRDSQEKIRASATASGFGVLFGGGFAIALGVASFVGGLVGWLLVMKKRVLQCSVCGAIVNAS
jgi:hypothetical protein